jgi:hypothetical protein
LTFDEFCREKFENSFDGSELAGMFMALISHEESLDPFQRSALERFRSILYKALSIEDLENIQSLYERQIALQCE